MSGKATSFSRRTASEAARFLLLSSAKAAGGIFIVALNVVLVRFLPPEDFGRYAFCITALILVDSIFGGPFDLAVIKLCGEDRSGAGDNRDAAARAGLHLKLAVAPLVALAAIPLLALSAPDAGLVTATVCAMLALLILRSVLVGLQVTGRVEAYAATEAIQLAVRIALVTFVLAVFAPSGHLVVAALAAGTLGAALLGGVAFAPQLFRLEGWRALPYRPISSAAAWYFATIALGAVIGRLDVLVLGWYGLTGQLGLFSAGQIIASIPELLGTYLAVFLTPRLVAAMRAGDVRSLHDTAQPLLLAGAVVSMLVALAAWPSLSSLLLPPAYAISGKVVLILLPGTLAALATIPLALPLVMFRRRHALLLFDALLFPAVAAAFVIVVPGHGAEGAAWVGCATTLVRSAYVMALAFRITREMPALSPTEI